MVSIIKNQLLKHLSRFTKNLSADKINLSTFKGEGELSNLELDENVLTELLELPTWLQLEKAWCNRVLFRIPWTKLKSVPIYLNLDEVNIIVKTCEELRTPQSPSAYSAVQGKYSFIHKVIDGITINVHTVYIIFNSPAFTASVQISRIIVESKSPHWQRGDLRVTRLKNSEKGQILVFKELEWQTARIEAKSTVDRQLTPLRLLTNHARCRLTIKKRLSDGFVLGSRLVLILDDLLWVLTDSQLKAALHFLQSLTGLIQRATLLTRQEKAARKLEVLPEYQAQVSQEARANTTPTHQQSHSAISNLFKKLDVIETSYHFLSQHIVLHLCDDPGNGRSCHPNLSDGGALQISIHGFQIDYYPYHLAIGDRRHWPRYREAAVPQTLWLSQSLAHFRSRLLDALEGAKPPPHTPLSRTTNQDNGNKPKEINSPTGGPGSSSNRKSSTSGSKEILKKLAKLMTTCIVLRIEDFCLYRVTTSGKKQALKEFISGDRDHISLPEDTNIVHAEFTHFYYPGDIAFPLPPPKIYVQLNPVQIYFDVDSCLWFNSFALNLYQSLQTVKAEPVNLMYIDVKIEAILPRIVFESTGDHQGQRDRPRSVHIQVTRATLTNIRSLEQSSRADLARCVDTLYCGSLFFGTEFPSKTGDAYAVTQKLLDHVSASDDLQPTDQRRLLWTDTRDVWSISMEPLWADFYGARSIGAGSRPVPFLDAVPVTVWLHMNENNNIHALLHISNLVSVQINHYPYLFLLRLAEELSELTTYLALDQTRILGHEQVEASSLVVATLLPQLEFTLVMPSTCPGKESSGGDLESVIPDSSSIADDLLTNAGSGATLWTAQTDTSLNKIPSDITMSFVTRFAVTESVTNVKISANSIDTSSKIANSIFPEMSSIQTVPSPASSNMNANIDKGLNSVKKGLNSLFTSIDSALKSGVEDMSDTMSWRSDASSDSEQYVVVAASSGGEGGADSMFKVQGTGNGAEPARAAVVELASEVLEEGDTTSPSEHSLASTYKRRDLVSIATFRLTQVELLQQSVGFNSSIKVQVQNITSDECGSIPWDEFQSKFSSRSRAWVDIGGNARLTGETGISRVRLRLDHQLSKDPANCDPHDRSIVRHLFQDNVVIRANDLRLELTMSAATGLADLIEDEILPEEQLPVHIELDDILITLVEDRPPNNITSPGAVPLRFKLDKLDVNRGTDGDFHVGPRPEPIHAATAPVNDEEMNRLRNELGALRARLSVLERAAEEVRTLRRSRDEADALRTSLASAQNDIERLLEDKRTLLDELRRMRDQIGIQQASHVTQTATNKR